MTLHAGYTLSFTVGTTAGTLTTIPAATGGLEALFLRVGKQGSTMAGLTEALATGMSVALREGVPLAAFTEELQSTRFVPDGPTDDPELPRATSVVDYVARRLAADFPAASAPRPRQQLAPPPGA